MPKVMVELKGNKFTCWANKNDDGTEEVSLTPNPEWHEEKRGSLLLDVTPDKGESVNSAAQKAYCAALGINQVLGKQTWQINAPPKPTPPPKPSVNPPKEEVWIPKIVIEKDPSPADPTSRESTLFTPPAAALAGAEAAELEDESRCSECGELGGHAEGCDVRSPSSSPAELGEDPGPEE